MGTDNESSVFSDNIANPVPPHDPGSQMWSGTFATFDQNLGYFMARFVSHFCAPGASICCACSSCVVVRIKIRAILVRKMVVSNRHSVLDSSECSHRVTSRVLKRARHGIAHSHSDGELRVLMFGICRLLLDHGSRHHPV